MDILRPLPDFKSVSPLDDCPQCKEVQTNSGEPVIEVLDARLTLGGTAILRGVNLRVGRGGLLALIGPNGSGKTTLLRAILGLQPLDSGEIRLFGSRDRRTVLDRIGYVPQRLALDRSFALSVREFLAARLRATSGWFFQSRRAIDAQLAPHLEGVGAAHLLDRPLAALSGGQLQRVLIAFSLLRKPELLLLDEPTAGIDTPGEQGFYDLIARIHRDTGITIVLVSHDLSMVFRQATWVCALNGVICCEGTPEHVMNAESLKQAYGLQVSPYHHHHHAH